MGLWLDDQALAGLPVEGAAWGAVVAAAESLSAGARPALANQDEKVGELTLAAALRFARTGHLASGEKALAVLERVPGTEDGGRTLALGRNLCSYVLAADLMRYRDPGFVGWLAGVRGEKLDGMSLVECQERRGNNWGTAATASLVAANLYLDDRVALDRAVRVFRGWLGDRSQYAGHDWGDLSWQADPAAPVGVNPKGSRRDGIDVDGCLPDDQRRTGGLTASPPAGNYVRAAISHQFVAATLLWNAGYPSFAWSEQALRRAVSFFRVRCGGSFSGDDGWVPPLTEWAYEGLDAGAGDPASVGKLMAWCAWTHGGRSRAGAPDPPPPPPPPPDPDPDPDPPPVDPCEPVRLALGVAVAQRDAAEASLADVRRQLDSANARISNARAALG